MSRCARCPKPLAPNSVRYCVEHLLWDRMYRRMRNGKITREEFDKWEDSQHYDPRRYARMALVETIQHCVKRARSVGLDRVDLIGIVRKEWTA